MIYFASTDLHESTTNLLKLGKKAGERSAQKKFREEVKKIEIQYSECKSEILRLKRENRKLQRELKKLGEAPC